MFRLSAQQQNNAPSNIAIYRGSFDPPHRGHLEVVQYCLDVMRCDEVYIIANEVNRHKPNRSSYALRKSMLEHMFSAQKAVFISDLTAENCIHSLRMRLPKVSIVGVVGSDVGAHQSKLSTKKLAVDKWLVIPRVADKDNMQQFVAEKELYCIAETEKLKEQHYSSSGIRDYFAKHDQAYHGEGASSVSDMPLSASVLAFIQQHQLYRNMDLAVQFFLEKNRLLLPKNIDVGSLKNITEQAGGLSGDMIFLVRDMQKDPVLFVKAFCTSDRLYSLRSELKAMDKMQSLGLAHSKTIRVPFYQCGTSGAILAMNVAQGVSLRTLMENVKDKQSASYQQHEEKLYLGLMLFAQALAELNSKQLEPIQTLDKTEIEPFLNKIKKMTDQMKANPTFFPTMDWQRLDHYLASVVQNFLNHPGCYGYTHGDPNANNFFIDLESKSVTMLDCAHFAAKWISAEGGPRGFPANEYNETLSLLALVCRRMGLSEKDNARIQEQFSQAYKTFAPKGFATDEALAFFECYELLRGIKNPLAVFLNAEGRKEYVPPVGLFEQLVMGLQKKFMPAPSPLVGGSLFARMQAPISADGVVTTCGRPFIKHA